MFNQSINWQQAAQNADNLSSGLVGLADLAGWTPAARSRQRAAAVFGQATAGNTSSSALARVGAKAMEAADASDPSAPFSQFSMQDLASVMTDPRADDFTRRTAAALYQRQLPKDPMEVEQAQLDMQFKRAQLEAMNRPDYGFTTMPDGTLVRTDQRSGTFERLGTFTGPRQMSQNDLADEYNTRIAMARQSGLTETDPRYQSFILTGKMPREDAQPLSATDKRAILEADELAAASEGAIALLGRAKELSKQAYDGMLAGWRGWGSSQVGSEAGNATIELNNILTESALGQLKAIFGGAPTEGERQILLDVQGSANQPQSVRDAIIDRAIAAAQRRLAFNRQRAQELRSGTFYQSGAGVAPAMSPPAPQSAAPSTATGRTSGGVSWSIEP